MSDSHRSPSVPMTSAAMLPVDVAATLVGRVWDGRAARPLTVLVEGGEVYDLSSTFELMADLTETNDPAAAAHAAAGRQLCSWEQAITATRRADRARSEIVVLSPVDVHVIKAAGVTFATSLLERLAEERSAGKRGV